MPNASFDFFHHYYGSPIPFFQMAAVFFHHYYGTQDRFGQISPSLSTTTGMCGLPKMGAKKTPRTFKKSVALQLDRYSIFISIM